MPKSIGYILDTPLQSWSRASEKHTHSLLTSEIKRVMMKHVSYIIIENVVGLQRSASLKNTIDSLNEAGFIANALELFCKTIIVGKR